MKIRIFHIAFRRILIYYISKCLNLSRYQIYQGYIINENIKSVLGLNDLLEV